MIFHVYIVVALVLRFHCISEWRNCISGNYFSFSFIISTPGEIYKRKKGCAARWCSFDTRVSQSISLTPDHFSWGRVSDMALDTEGPWSKLGSVPLLMSGVLFLFVVRAPLWASWGVNHQQSFFLISGLSESLLPDRSPPPPHATIKDLNLRHNSGPGWLKMDTMDGGHSGRTSKLYSPSGPSGGATTLPKDPPLYISIVQLISYVGSSLSHCIFPLCPRDSLCLF